MKIIIRTAIAFLLTGLFVLSTSFLLPDENLQSLEKRRQYQWYERGAEINSYKLSQWRYGESRQGKAILLYVTEPYNIKKHVKSDSPQGADIIPALKLNKIVRFTTGIYDYSLMTSIFTRCHFETPQLAQKITTTCQDWCGQSFIQMNRRADQMVIRKFSYFENEGDMMKSLPSAYKEEQAFLQARLNPRLLKTGAFKMLPSDQYLRFNHKAIELYEARAELSDSTLDKKPVLIYKITYPQLQRHISLTIESHFPYRILQWEEMTQDHDGRTMVSHAKLTNTHYSSYWEESSKKYDFKRKTLKLEENPHFW